MQILLINDNSSVSKLINLTAKKYDYVIEEISDISELSESHKDIIFVDDDVSNDLDINLLKEKTGCNELVYIASKGSQTPQEYKYTLIKPFLPSDFKNIVETIVGVGNTIDEDTNIEEIAEKVTDFDEEKEDFLLDELEMSEENDDMTTLETEQNIGSEDEDKEDDLSEEHFDDEEELSIDEDLFADDEDSIKVNDISEDDKSQSNNENTAILDKEDVEIVKELLDENEDIDDELEIADEDDAGTMLYSAQDDFDISDLENDENDIDDFSLEEDENEKESEHDEKQKDDKPEEDFVIENKDLETKIDDMQTIDEEDKNLKNRVDDKQDEIGEINQENDTQSEQMLKATEELDLVDEHSLKELFGQSDDEAIEEINKKNGKEMEIESFEEIKPKKKKKKKKLKKEKISSLQKEISSKLLDIDTLREVLDGMEIRIKFYKKK